MPRTCESVTVELGVDELVRSWLGLAVCVSEGVGEQIALIAWSSAPRKGRAADQGAPAVLVAQLPLTVARPVVAGARFGVGLATLCQSTGADAETTSA